MTTLQTLWSHYTSTCKRILVGLCTGWLLKTHAFKTTLQNLKTPVFKSTLQTLWSHYTSTCKRILVGLCTGWLLKTHAFKTTLQNLKTPVFKSTLQTLWSQYFRSMASIPRGRGLTIGWDSPVRWKHCGEENDSPCDIHSPCDILRHSFISENRGTTQFLKDNLNCRDGPVRRGQILRRVSSCKGTDSRKKLEENFTMLVLLSCVSLDDI